MKSFVICLGDSGCPASLIVGKVYRSLPDELAEAKGLIRIVDEDSSEPGGYLYPAAMFTPIELPSTAERILFASGGEG